MAAAKAAADAAIGLSPALARENHRRLHTLTRTQSSVVVLGGCYYDEHRCSPATLFLALQVAKDLSTVSVQTTHRMPPLLGHTTHAIDAKSIISLFGIHANHTGADCSLVNEENILVATENTPPHRYRHTSAQLDNEIFVLGGRSTIENDDNHVLGDIWRLSWPRQSWTLVGTLPQARWGHVTLPYNNQLLTCFGADASGQLDASCVWFDTLQLVTTPVPAQAGWPAPRTDATLTAKNSTHAVLFGGQIHHADHFLAQADAWLLDFSQPLVWTRLNDAPSSRTGHAALAMSDNRLLIHGGQSDTSEDDSLLWLDMDTGTWTTTALTTVPEHRVLLQKRAPPPSSSSSSRSLSGGAIAGIVISILIILAFIGITTWYYFRRRYDSPSRASHASRASRTIQQQTPWQELARPETLGTYLQESSIGSHQTASQSSHFQASRFYDGVSVSEPALASSVATEEQPNNDHETENDTNRPRLSKSFRRLTLRLLSGRQDDASQNAKDRADEPSTPPPDTQYNRSSLFGLRHSRLLQPPSQAAQEPMRSPASFHSCASVGDKSVTSMQWIEFNNDMDYKRDWRGSGGNLCVTNARQSTATINSSRPVSYADASVFSSPRSHVFQHRFSSRPSSSLNPSADTLTSDRFNENNRGCSRESIPSGLSREILE